MLRNHYLIKVSKIVDQQCCGISHKHALNAKQFDMSVNRQSKIMRKFFGERVSGSKKRWYPDADGSNTSGSAVFEASKFGKPTKGNGKNNERRTTALNKLFMKHITDLLATGEIAEHILGRGLQVTRVKTTSDFAGVRVYWMGSHDPVSDAQLEVDLHRCSGQLRHELSQLRLMGEVPRISFVRDRKYENLTHVTALLKNLNLVPEDDENGDLSRLEESDLIKEEFFGSEIAGKPDKYVLTSDIPNMRHDVFGLDHRGIMLNILTKMKKSKLAWENHYNQGMRFASEIPTKLEEVRKQVEDVRNRDKFERFLVKQQHRKNTPERKKYNRYNEVVSLDRNDAVEDAPILTGIQKSLYNAQDFIYDNHEK